MVKFCKNCSNFRPWREQDCNTPTGEVSLVSGDALVKQRSAWNERRSKVTIFGRIKCGPDAIFYKEE